MTDLTFGHIVNHRKPKGTRFVFEATAKAQEMGARFSFIFAERIPHKKAMKLYKDIDILLEQFVIGFYGLQAVEFARMEKPVVVWMNPKDKVHMPVQMWDEIPFISVAPPDLAKTIKKISGFNRDVLKEIGRRGKAFVEKWHDEKKIADQVLFYLMRKNG